MEQIRKNFQDIIKRIPQLPQILNKINSANIKYGLCAGAHVAILTAKRIPTDMDFLVADQDFNKLKRLFPFAETKDNGNAYFLYIGLKREIEFMSFDDIFIDKSKYKFRLSKLCWQHAWTLRFENSHLNILNEADTVLLKSMLQRGKEQDKHDLNDIEVLVKNRKINKEYLKDRLKEVNADERILKVLKHYQLI